MTRTVLIRGLGTVMVIAAVLWALNVQRIFGLNLYKGQFLYLLVALSAVVIFIQHPFDPARPGLSRAIDIPLCGLGTLAAIYTIFRFPQLLDDASFRDFSAAGLVVAAALIVLLIEGVRRTAGIALAVIAVAAILIAVFAQYLPGVLAGRPFRADAFLYQMAFQDGNILGAPLSIVGTVVIAFVLMGAMLQAAGGGDFFSNLAAAMMGASRGGSAKIAVTASGFFGAISGSAVSNVVSTGMITIPMMKKAGYKDDTAAGLEAVASTGGQLVPPVMGAAAFLMAVVAEVEYSAVVVASIIPAVLYYVGLFLQIDLIAARDGIRGERDEQLSVRDELRHGWVFILPFVVLIYGLFVLVWRPEYAALVATATMIAALVIFGHRGNRPTLKTFADAMAGTAEAGVSIIFIAAVAGIVIGALNSSGVLFNISEAIVDIGGRNLPLLLVLSAIICIILGMGMPTVGVYALLSSLIAVPLVDLGIEKISAHLFVLYLGMMSMMTPPVAIAAFAAAAIARTDPIRTGFKAMRLGWSAYVIPFVFVVEPALILNGTLLDSLEAVLRACLGIWLVTAAIVGYGSASLQGGRRAGYAVLGIALLVPGSIVPGGTVPALIILALGIAVVVYEFIIVRQAQTARGGKT
ncbi:TRAP transporter, 4TM/12TM fusion protein [Paracoccus halophilus]|uniref:TRAP transporter, 4TM/12TM fusion protein n=1 Tax=Paracoccus halophilus TaxID=376733 RepID=A0A1I0UBR4_9RHOB|nr:TRAP transporter fused permease subunit [Paracoccus halophilus]SFA61350.1 TRAP transporter, 4TM/12TM fusion protein [Paracoccus halophilus]